MLAGQLGSITQGWKRDSIAPRSRYCASESFRQPLRRMVQAQNAASLIVKTQGPNPAFSFAIQQVLKPPEELDQVNTPEVYAFEVAELTWKSNNVAVLYVPLLVSRSSQPQATTITTRLMHETTCSRNHREQVSRDELFPGV